MFFVIVVMIHQRFIGPGQHERGPAPPSFTSLRSRGPLITAKRTGAGFPKSILVALVVLHRVFIAWV
jgi:hypothetical protein